MQKNRLTLISAAVLTGIASVAIAQPSSPAASTSQTPNTTGNQSSVESSAAPIPTVAPATKGTKPADSPGYVVVEEDWWFPFRDEFSNSIHKARTFYRRTEERSAAGELRKAIGWLEFAKAHATEETHPKLQTAISELKLIATDLESGRTLAAAALDKALARASLALAYHHYFKAETGLATRELKYAGQHLMSAADHIRFAANNANYEYGVEMDKLCDDYDNAMVTKKDETTVYAFDRLTRHLRTIKAELEILAQRLDDPAK